MLTIIRSNELVVTVDMLDNAITCLGLDNIVVEDVPNVTCFCVIDEAFYPSSYRMKIFLRKMVDLSLCRNMNMSSTKMI